MKGIPQTIATKQDVIHLCADLPVRDAQKVLKANRHFFEEDEYSNLRQDLITEKRMGTLKRNKAKKRLVLINNLAADISALKGQAVSLETDIRAISKQKAKAQKERDDLERVLHHVRGLEKIQALPVEEPDGFHPDWQALESQQGYFSKEEQKSLQRVIAAGKRKEKMQISGARRMWAKYHELGTAIPGMQAEIDRKGEVLKGLLKTVAGKQKQKTELEGSRRV